MKMRDVALLMASSLLAMQLPGCMMGGSTEIGNSRSTITGTIAGGAQNSEDVSVQLVSEDYIPGNVAADKVFMADVDGNGAYTLSDVPQGRYYLNARGSGKRLLRGPIEINAKETDLAVDSLRVTSRLNLAMPSGDTVNTMFIQGTIDAVMVESDTVMLDSVPVGNINLVACKVDPSNSLGRTIVDSMRITITTGAEDTTVASFGNAAPQILTGVSELEREIPAFDPSYKVTIQASDPEGGEVRYFMTLGPAWLRIDSVTGVVTCAADTSLLVGTHAVAVKVMDSAGASSVIRWDIMVIGGAVDIESPIITLKGFDTLLVPDSITTDDLYSQFRESGYSAYDNRDGDITTNVIVSMDTVESFAMTLVIRYDVTDAAGNSALTVRRHIFSAIGPESSPVTITLVQADTVQELRLGIDTWIEPGYAAYDRDTADITASVVVDTSDLMKNINVPGTYYVTYTVALGATLAVQRTRTVRVTGGSNPYDTIAPVITLMGQDTVLVSRSDVDTFPDPGASAYDDVDGDISDGIIVTGNIDMTNAGTYTLIYSVSDKAGNTTVKRRCVIVGAQYLNTLDTDTFDIDTTVDTSGQKSP